MKISLTMGKNPPLLIVNITEVLKVGMKVLKLIIQRMISSTIQRIMKNPMLGNINVTKLALLEETSFLGDSKNHLAAIINLKLIMELKIELKRFNKIVQFKEGEVKRLVIEKRQIILILNIKINPMIDKNMRRNLKNNLEPRENTMRTK